MWGSKASQPLDPAAIMDPVSDTSHKHLEAAEAAVAALETTFDGSDLKALRTIVAGYPDMGSDGAGQVVASLFMLLEHLIAGGRIDRDALIVHVRAWRLMASVQPDPQAKSALLAGLKAVRDLHTQSKAA